MAKEKSRRKFLEESGVNVDLFELENEYSYRNILYAMEAYATYRIKILNGEIRESGKEFCDICGKRIKMKGDGTIELLCERSTQKNSL